jgi:putative ABC transport system permease protein
MNELRFAFRRLRATPIVTLSAIACLSIGVWIACLVSAVGHGFFRPRLGIYAADRLVQIDEKDLFVNYVNGRLRPPCCFNGRTTSKAVTDSLAARKVFASIGYYAGGTPIRVGSGSRTTMMLSSGMMDVLGINVAVGRRFIPADDSAGAVIISHGLWRTMFGGDPQVIGRRIDLWWSRGSVPIVGVMPEGFMFPRNGGRTDAYLSAGVRSARDVPRRTMLARLRDDTEIDDVRPVVREIALRSVSGDREALTEWFQAQMKRGRPAELLARPVEVSVDRYYNEPIYQGTITFMLLVIGCGLAVVLIAAANVANLLLVRGAARRQEIAVRMALGAARGQIVRGLILETALLSATGIALGFLIAFWQWQLIDTGFEGRDFLGHIDASTLPVALGAGVLLTLIVGVWPGIRATSLSLEQVLRDTRRTGINASPLDNILGRMVAASTAATVMLLVSAALLSLSANDWVANNTMNRNALTSTLTFDDQQGRGQRAGVALAALGRLRGTVGVGVAALGAPPTERESAPLRAVVDGGAPRRLDPANVFDVSHGYFEAMDIRFVEGRPFTLRETRDSVTSVVISRSVASRLFGAETRLGRRFRYWAEADSIVHEAIVVGVSEDLTGYGGPMQIYRAFGTLAPARTTAFVTPQFRVTVEQAAITKALRTVPGLLSSDVSSLEAQRRGTRKGIQDYMRTGFIMFAIVGIVLAAIGTYGIVAYSVARRTHEIGVRMALGAQQTRVTWMIVEQGLKITLTGIVFGLFLSYAAARILGSMLADVKTDYSIAMAGTVALVLVISIVACWIPGARAGRLNPVEALRAE